MGVMSSLVATEGAASLCTGAVVAYHVVRATAVTAPAAVAYRMLFRPALWDALSSAVMDAALALEPEDVEWVRRAEGA